MTCPSILALCFCLWSADDKSQDADVPKAQPQTYRLLYQFPAGASVHYDVTQTTTRLSRSQDREQKITETIGEQKHLKVVDSRKDGSFVLQTVFDRVVMEADMGPKHKFRFDSRESPRSDPPGFRNIRKSIARPQHEVHLAANGKLVAVRPLVRGAKQKEAARNNDGSSFLVVFPDHEIAVGETWTEKYVVELKIRPEVVQQITIKRTYRFHSVKDGIARIRYSSRLETPVHKPEQLAQLSQTTPSGTIDFDIKAGQIVKRTTKTDKTILNASGPRSMLRTVSTRIERRVSRPISETAALD